MKPYLQNCIKYSTLILLLTMWFSNTHAQVGGVGINSSGNQADASAMLDVDSDVKGVLIPRIALTASDVAAPVAAPATSLLVYNTATAGAGNTAVTPGFYFWNGTEWERLVSGIGAGAGTDDQNLTGANLTGNILQIDIEDGNSVSVDLSPLASGTAGDNQNLSLNADMDSILIEDGTGIALSSVGEGLSGITAFVANLGDSLLSNNNFITNLGDTILGNTTFITNLGDTLLNQSAWLDQLQDSIDTDEQNLSMSTALDSILIEDGTGVAIEDVGTGLTDNQNFINNLGDTLLDNPTFVTNLGDTLAGNTTFVNNFGDTLLHNNTFVTNMGDTLLGNSTFITNLGDSIVANSNLVGNVYDSITNNSAWLDQLQDSIDTDDQNLSMSTALDSILIEDGTGVAIEDVGTGLTDNQNFINNLGDTLLDNPTFVTNLGDTLAGNTTFVNNFGDTLLHNNTFVNNLGDTLLGNNTFITNLGDSIVENSNLVGNVYDSITNNSQWINDLRDSINTDDQALTLTGNSLDLEDGGSVDLTPYLDNTDNQDISGSSLSGTDLTIGISGGNSETIDLSSLQDGVTDADADPANEYNTGVVLNGTDLEVTDGGGTIVTDLSSLQDGTTDADADPANEYNTGVILNGTNLEVTDGGGTIVTDLSSLQDGTTDADADPANEYNTGVVLNGTDLEVTDGGGTIVTDLSSLQDGTGTDNQDISGSNLTGTDLTIGISGGNSETIDLSSLQDGVTDADADPANEYNTGVVLNGTDLEVTDGGGTIVTDLSSLQDGTTDADADPANEYNTGVILNGTDLEVTDGGGTIVTDLSSLQDGTGTDNQDISGSNLSGTDLTIGITGGNSEIVDLSSLQGDLTDDAWVNNSANSVIELVTLSDGVTARPAGTEVFIQDDGVVNIGNSDYSDGLLRVNGTITTGGMTNENFAPIRVVRKPSGGPAGIIDNIQQGVFGNRSAGFAYNYNFDPALNTRDVLTQQLFSNTNITFRSRPTGIGVWNYLMVLENTGNIGIGHPAPDASAILDISSNSKGIVIPRMTTAERTAIATPVEGLEVYDTDTQSHWYFDGTVWVENSSGTDDQNISGSGLSGTDLTIGIENGTAEIVDLSSLTNNEWRLDGNAGTTVGTNFLGTTDDEDLMFKRNNVQAGLIQDNNTALGVDAFSGGSTGSSNTAIGFESLNANTTGSWNSAYGSRSMLMNQDGANNVAIGGNALRENVDGSFNMAIGTSSLRNNTSGSNNVAVGTSALYDSQGDQNVAIGDKAMRLNTTGSNNTAIGDSALFANTTISNLTAVGANALKSNTTGYSNTAVGNNALANNTTGIQNTAIGDSALYLASGNSNIAIGFSASSMNIGSNNVGVGNKTLLINEGARNAAFGNNSLISNTTGNNNSATGYSALEKNETGHHNTAVGNNSLRSNISGTYNTAIGRFALYSGTTSNNTAIGGDALRENMSGTNNTAVGKGALRYDESGSNNIAIGVESMRDRDGGDGNTALGHRSLFSNENDYSTAIGYQAGYNSTSGMNNTFLGASTGLGITTGSSNTILGANVTGLAPALSNNIIIADGDGNRRINVDANGNVGIGTTTPQAKLHLNASNMSTGILLRDASNSAACPTIEVRGKRVATNNSQSFSGGVALSKYGPASFSNDRIGTIYMGASHTDGSEGNILYTSSISGVAEGNFTDASTMPTGLAFYTGSQGTSLGTPNTTFGTERMRISNTGNVGIGTAAPSSKLDIRTSSLPITGKHLATNTRAYLTSGYRELQTGISDATFFMQMKDAGSNNPPLSIQPEGGRVGFGTTTPHNSAKVEINSTTQGFLLPRMTTAQRTAIASPAAGLMVFDTDLSKFYGYDGSAWVALH